MLFFLPEFSMKPTVGEAVSWAIGGARIDLFMGIDDGSVALAFTNAVAKIRY